MIAHIHDGNSEQQLTYIHIMVGSGAATHVCPPWFAQEFPIQPLSATWTTTTNSHEQWDQTLRIQVGLHAQCRRTTNRHTILCVWRTSTNCISLKTRRTRLHSYLQWTKTDYTSKRIQHNIDQTTKPVLPQGNSASNPNKLQTTDTADPWRNNSNDCTNNTYITRSRTSSWRKQCLLDVQQWRILGTSTQDKEEGTLPTIQDMSSSNWPVGKLSKDNSQETGQEQWQLWGTIFKAFQINNRKQSYQDKLGLEKHGSSWSQVQQYQQQQQHHKGLMTGQPKANRFHKFVKQRRDSGEDSDIHTNTSLYNKSTSKHTTDTNQQINISTSTIYNGQNRRPLDTRGTHVEKSSSTTTQWTLHTTTDTTWTWHYKTAWASHVHESTRWNLDDKVWWSMDITRKKNDRQDMDRINKLWRRNNIQGGIHHRWRRRTTSSIASKRHQSTTIWRTFHTDHGVQSARKAKAEQTTILHKRQAHFQLYKGIHDKQVIPVLSAIDVETGMSMVTMVQDKQRQFTYLTQCLQSFLIECRRTQAILAPTFLQSDQEENLVSLLKTTARTIGSNITVRQSPAYSSQSQGSIERFHRTLFNQVRTLTAQLKNNYKLNNLSINHPIMPSVIRHAAYLLNSYGFHNDGKTSYFRRWNKER